MPAEDGLAVCVVEEDDRLVRRELLAIAKPHLKAFVAQRITELSLDLPTEERIKTKIHVNG